jgi:uncharacterized protein (DUF4213/DUF364 family)
MDMYDALKRKATTLAREHRLLDEAVKVETRLLTPEEAIGTPEESDYPILRGKERMLSARLHDAVGHAFTDTPGRFRGTVNDILQLSLDDNFKRAVFIATVNALTRHTGTANRTVHCRDDEPKKCAAELVDFIKETNRTARRILLVGLQPRMLEQLAACYEVRVTNMDHDNVGTTRSGITIDDSTRVDAHIAWADLLLVTGTTIVNGSIEKFLNTGKPTIFYGVSIAGAAALLGLKRYCPLGK